MFYKKILRCSNCGVPASFTSNYIDKEGYLHCGYCGNIAPPVMEKRIDTMYFYIERRGLRCPSCGVSQAFITIKKNGRRYRCSKCKHEWDIEERLDYKERREEFLRNPVMKKYMKEVE